MSETTDKDSCQTNGGFYNINGVKILLYNVYGLPPLVRPFCKQSYTQQRLEDIFFNQSEEPRHLKDYDVACFCEVFTDYTGLYSRIIKHLRALGFNYFVRGPKRSISDGKLIGGGLFLCSKLPIKRTKSIIFPTINNYFYNIDSLAAKGAIYAMIELDDWYHLHLTLTHAQSTYHNKFQAYDRDECIRKHQFLSLANFLSEQLEISACSPLDPVVVLGDFNVSAFNLDPNTNNSSQEYLSLLETLSLNNRYKVIDLIYNASGNRHPVTWITSVKSKNQKNLPRKYNNPLESIRTGQRLDYIFQLIPVLLHPVAGSSLCRYLLNTSNDYMWDFESSSSEVREFYSKESFKRKYSTLSDHYALTALLCIKKRNFDDPF